MPVGRFPPFVENCLAGITCLSRLCNLCRLFKNLGGFHDAIGRPKPDHLGALPPFDVAAEAADGASHVLDDVGTGEGEAQPGRKAESAEGQISVVPCEVRKGLRRQFTIQFHFSPWPFAEMSPTTFDGRLRLQSGLWQAAQRLAYAHLHGTAVVPEYRVRHCHLRMS